MIQNAICRALEGCFGLKNPLALRTWFYRILVNEALQYLRRQKREVPLGEEHTEAMTYEEPAFDEDKQAYEAVMQLSEPMKTVIILHYYEDLTLKQIAEITDTPLSTVKTRLYSALKKLKLILKEEEKMNPENGKKTYESIEIPKNLNETVMQTIASKNKEELKMKYESNENKKASEAKKSYRPVWRGCVAAAAAVLVAGTMD